MFAGAVMKFGRLSKMVSYVIVITLYMQLADQLILQVHVHVHVLHNNIIGCNLQSTLLITNTYSL